MKKTNVLLICGAMVMVMMIVLVGVAAASEECADKTTYNVYMQLPTRSIDELSRPVICTSIEPIRVGHLLVPAGETLQECLDVVAAGVAATDLDTQHYGYEISVIWQNLAAGDRLPDISLADGGDYYLIPADRVADLMLPAVAPGLIPLTTAHGEPLQISVEVER